MRVDFAALREFLPVSILQNKAAIVAVAVVAGVVSLAVAAVIYMWPASGDIAAETAVVNGPLFTPVTLTPPAPIPAARPSKLDDSTSSSRPLDDTGVARAVQRNLKRAGCYDGPVNGAWTLPTRKAMAEFTGLVNARLPLDRPDPVLLALLEAHGEVMCDQNCTDDGRDCQAPPARREDARHEEPRKVDIQKDQARTDGAPKEETAALDDKAPAETAAVPVPVPAVREARASESGASAMPNTTGAAAAAAVAATASEKSEATEHRSSAHRYRKKPSLARAVSKGFRNIQRNLNMIFR